MDDTGKYCDLQLFNTYIYIYICVCVCVYVCVCVCVCLFVCVYFCVCVQKYTKFIEKVFSPSWEIIAQILYSLVTNP